MMTEQPTERRWLIEYLVRCGMDRVEAEQVLVDDDLWLLMPEQRFGFPPNEESVRQWEQTVQLIRALSEGVTNMVPSLPNRAATQLIWDAQARAEEALRRVRERAERSESK
jgi:hypothetical protein